jgi:hypothetical protein
VLEKSFGRARGSRRKMDPGHEARDDKQAYGF